MFFALLCALPSAARPEAAAPSPPPGTKILAETHGKQGLVRVEERDGLRLLTINGVMQGSRRVSKAADDNLLVEGDALVALALAAKPKATRALIIGLGTGQTAAELVAHGLTVEAVELEPAVVEYARKYFGYRGPAEVLDGLAALQRRREYDLVLVDAAVEKKPPAELVDSKGLALLFGALSSGGVAAVRMIGRPDTAPVTGILSELGERFHVLLGSGLADEEQNLYLLASGVPLAVHAPDGIPMQFLRAWGYDGGRYKAEDLRSGLGNDGKQVLVVGYLSRIWKNRLALDLPHSEMGGVRFRLLGAGAEALVPLAPKPSQIVGCDEGDERQLAKTLHQLVGGGGVKRCEVRFSPVVAAVEGRLRFHAAVDPDRAAMDYLAGMRGSGSSLPVESLLPEGGVLYDLEVVRVAKTYDLGAWRRFSPRRKPLVEAIARAARAGDLPGVAKGLRKLVDVLHAELGPLAGRFHYVLEMQDLASRLPETMLAKNDPATLAIACERASGETADYQMWWSSDDAWKIAKPLKRRAIRAYEAIAYKDKSAKARAAAARVLRLYETETDLYGPETDRKTERLKRRFGEDLEAVEFDPTLFDRSGKPDEPGEPPAPKD
jgi:SAM-dependent methyltransferase